MLSHFFQFLKTIWKQCNIRIVILFSLFLQIFLIVSAPSRKRTRGPLVFLVWLAYLLADWAAGYCIGLISKNLEEGSKLSQNGNLMAFWGPFLLLHLGGPDSISAFALEDNELWLRHLLALNFQSVTAGYVFLLTLPHNTLLVPTILMFVAGLIKYGERIHALYVAAVNNFRKSLLPKPDAGPNYAKLMEEHSSRREAGLPAKIIVIPELRQASHEATKDNEEHVSEPTQHFLPNEEHVFVPTQHVLSNEEHVELVQKAFFFFHKFQGLIVDRIYSFKDRHDSQQYWEKKSAEEALRLIEIELNFMYEVFYTKNSVVRHYRVWFWGKFVSLILIISTVLLFIKEERHGHGFDKLDVKVTYALLCGALVLDVLALFMRFFTDYTATLSDESLLDLYSASFFQKFQLRLFKHLNECFLARFLRRREPAWSTIEEGTYKGHKKLCTKFSFRRWCGSISGYNLLKYCLDESIPSFSIVQRVRFKMVACVQWLSYDILYQWRYRSTNPFLKELWEYVFDKLKEKSKEAQDIEAIQSICSARGEGVVQKEKLESLKPFVDPNEVAFDQSLLLWHIATALCYTKEKRDKGEKKDKRRKMCTLIQEIKNKSLILWHFVTTLCQAKGEVGVEEKKEQKDEKDKRMKISMLLSDYMLYLLMMQPNMMSALAGIGQIRFQDTCEEAKRFFMKRISAQWDRKAMLKEACETLLEVPTEQKPIDVKGDRSKSLLFDACRLAKELNKLEDKKWEIIASVWVELLSYAACHCRPTGHVQLLSKGGELISFVWLLMVQLGLSTQFQIKEGDARAKLIVGLI